MIINEFEINTFNIYECNLQFGKINPKLNGKEFIESESVINLLHDTKIETDHSH